MEQFSEINIKGMVCNRCIFTIKEALRNHGYPVDYVSLGKVIFERPVGREEKGQISSILASLGFSLINDKKEQLLTNIKNAIGEWVDSQENSVRQKKLSLFLSERLNKAYDSLSEFFSLYEGKTIERYAIALRIEKVMELLIYSEMTLSEIAFLTGFSSVHHLSFQFKKTTGMLTSAYKPIRTARLQSNPVRLQSETMKCKPEII